ncbi:hypothetical protein [Dysgonomonas macrotermitis]|uniref:Beta-lactamase-inhibitor-like, PepSY-like n=1 Tax=Dysgonomonas macrotermitis TaxID=1346286 RepID=A0A1M5GN82_9BACT|nr:hypothetical protein [Dysgonomonas macrotermitis]SHG05118.1 hypothetical protein SAMN05444362_11470 [Dysgonomonas macrotermitis]
MRIYPTAVFYTISLLLISCQHRTIEVTPPVSSQYTYETADSLLNIYEISHPAKTRPTDQLSKQHRTDFPQAKDIEWKMSNDIYSVKFEIGDTDYKAYYNKEANLIAYKYEIEEKDLPAIVKNASIAVYPDYHFEEITKMIYGSQTIYKLELERNDHERIIVLRSDGTILHV